MKKIILLILTSSLMAHLSAQNYGQNTHQVRKQDASSLLQEVKPSYLEDAISTNDWDSNWFISLKGGISSFCGKPIGCEDFTGRLKPLMNLSAGKWITPKLGLRVAFQGFTFKDCGETMADSHSSAFQNLHGDLFFNVADYFHHGLSEQPKWDFAPYFGLGLIRNGHTGAKPFAFSYGIFSRYRLCNRLHLSIEIGNTTTFQHFDGKGVKDKLGDHLLQGSIGLDFTIGHVGWKKIIDVRPYQQRTEELQHYISSYEKSDTSTKYNRIKYSGLVALHERLMTGLTSGDSAGAIHSDVSSTVGAPVYFFFKKNSYRLIDRAQFVNLKKIAKTAKENSLNIRITGAADDYTGTNHRNKVLSKQRAGYIAYLLTRKGVKRDRISRDAEGGIKYYSLVHANRFARLELYK